MKNIKQLIVTMLVLVSLGYSTTGSGTDLTAVHPNFELKSLRPAGFEPMVLGMDWLSDERLVVAHWGGDHGKVHQRQYKGKVYIVSGVTGGNASNVSVREIVSGLEDPAGLTVVNDTIYVSGGNIMVRLVDTDGNDVIDRIDTLYHDTQKKERHEFFFGLRYKEGLFYGLHSMTKNNPVSSNTNVDRGVFFAMDPKTGQRHIISRGLRTPLGLGIGPDGEFFCSDVQGNWLPTNKIIHLKQGGFYGYRAYGEGALETPPVAYLPQPDIGGAPGEMIMVKEGVFKDHMLFGDVTYGGVQRLFIEKVQNEYQGVVFRFSGGFEAGVSRMNYGPDGHIYIGGVGEDPGWAWKTKRHGLQKLVPKGENNSFEMLAIRNKNGTTMEIEFTQPASEAAANKSNYTVKQWYFQPTSAYGGSKKGTQTLSVQSAVLSADKKKVTLTLAGLQAGKQVYFQLNNNIKSGTNQSLWTKEAWYTLNKIGPGVDAKAKAPVVSSVESSIQRNRNALQYNSVSKEFFVAAKQSYSLELVNIQSKVIGNWQGTKSGFINLEKQSLPFGVYWIRGSVDQNIIHQSVLVQ